MAVRRFAEHFGPYGLQWKSNKHEFENLIIMQWNNFSAGASKSELVLPWGARTPIAVVERSMPRGCTMQVYTYTRGQYSHLYNLLRKKVFRVHLEPVVTPAPTLPTGVAQTTDLFVNNWTSSRVGERAYEHGFKWELDLAVMSYSNTTWGV